MIKQDWNISGKEKSRILNLHERATKKLYLIREQNDRQSEKSWRICSTIIFQQGDKYFAQRSQTGDTVEIPKLSEVSGIIQGGKLVLNQLTKNGLEMGQYMSFQESCTNKKPQAYTQTSKPFCYFDDMSSSLQMVNGKETLVKLNIPRYGVLSEDGSLRTASGFFTPEDVQKDKNGVEIKYGVSRSRSFILEVSIASNGEELRSGGENERPEEEPKPEFKEIPFDLESPFVFDKTDLTPEAEKKFQELLQNIKKYYNNIAGDVEVITSASIDADPITKEKYNMDLSMRRANKIIERLKSETGNNSLRFIPKPIGQTEQFAPGLKYPKHSQSETGPNRRLIIKLPKIKVQVK